MDKEAMKLLILKSLSKKLGADYHISIREVLKTNLKKDGLTILRNGDYCTPTIYLEPFYEELEKGETIENVVDHILHIYLYTRSDMEDFDVTPVRDFNYVKERLYVTLINKHSNTELLQDVPHSLFLDDFAVVVRCLVNMDLDAPASFLVHDSHLGLWNVDQEALLTIATENTREMFGVDLRNMEELLCELMDSFPEDSSNQLPIWVLSNKRRFAGATAVLFDDVLKKFANDHGSFYVIFSSLHEVLLIPAEQNPDVDIFTQMNQEVNATQVKQDEVLGTHAYFYDKEKGFVL